MTGVIWGILIASCVAIVGKSFLAFPRSPSPLLKKKLAPNDLDWLNDVAIVREMVDFPVPAIPFNQNMHLPWGDAAHSLIWVRISVRVPGRH
jgi:hypothetical protein